MAKACLLICGCLCVILATCQFGEACQTIDNEAGSCISIEYCKPYFSVYKFVRENNSVALATYLTNTLCGKDRRKVGQINKVLHLAHDKVCCPKYGISRTSLKAAPTSTTTTIAPTTTTTIGPTTTTIIAPTTTTLGKNCTNGKTCISISECPTYSALIKYHETDDRARKALIDGICVLENQSNTLKVCCPSQLIRKGTLRSVSNTTFSEPPVCGYSTIPLTRVVMGIPAELGQVPWMALLGYKIGAKTDWMCGGSLVSSKHVLSAAHCIHNNENDLYLVRLGELDYARDDDGAKPIDVKITEMIKHEKYNDKSFTNDIGILVLEMYISFTDYIRPICIPKNSEMRGENFVNYRPFVAGWGRTTFNGPVTSHLRIAQLRVPSNDVCAKAYEQYQGKSIDDRVVCADSDEGRGACNGDSGGPLMILHKNEEDFHYYYLIGVHSFATRCADADYPGVYTRVTHFLPWIEQKIFGA